MKSKFWPYLFLCLWGFFFYGGIAAFAADKIPTLLLKESIPIAEEALGKAGLNLDSYVLYQAEFSLSSRGNYWFLTYHPRAQGASEVFVKIYMNGQTEISGADLMGQRR